jgi:polysaccharide export outer membrane protein
MRRDGDQQLRIPVRLADLMKDGDISANVSMRPGDVLIIPESRF